MADEAHPTQFGGSGGKAIDRSVSARGYDLPVSSPERVRGDCRRVEKRSGCLESPDRFSAQSITRVKIAGVGGNEYFAICDNRLHRGAEPLIEKLAGPSQPKRTRPQSFRV